MPAAPGKQLGRSLRQALPSGVRSGLGVGGSRAEIWQRFPLPVAEQEGRDRQDHPPLSG